MSSQKEKELKIFTQCAEFMNPLDKTGILNVFRLLSLHFEIMPISSSNTKDNNFYLMNNLNESNNFSESTTTNDNNYIEEKVDNKIVNSFKVNNGNKNKNNKRAKKVELTNLTDYDFYPSDSENLKEFYNKYKPSSNLEINLIFLYYFQEIRKEKDITADHIYSAYRHIGLKVPSFPQTIYDTKSRRGWIETENKDLKLTTAGLNHINHDLQKNNE
jgi:hypothetical protein